MTTTWSSYSFQCSSVSQPLKESMSRIAETSSYTLTLWCLCLYFPSGLKSRWYSKSTIKAFWSTATTARETKTILTKFWGCWMELSPRFLTLISSIVDFRFWNPVRMLSTLKMIWMLASSTTGTSCRTFRTSFLLAQPWSKTWSRIPLKGKCEPNLVARAFNTLRASKSCQNWTAGQLCISNRIRPFIVRLPDPRATCCLEPSLRTWRMTCTCKNSPCSNNKAGHPPELIPKEIWIWDLSQFKTLLKLLTPISEISSPKLPCTETSRLTENNACSIWLIKFKCFRLLAPRSILH